MFLEKKPNFQYSQNYRILQNSIFHGYKFSRTLSKTAKSAKINTSKVYQGLNQTLRFENIQKEQKTGHQFRDNFTEMFIYFNI